jgi:hypothetical protein
MSTISEIWNDGRAPIRDGLYLSNGHSYEVRVDSTADKGFEVLGEFDLDAVLTSEPDWLTTVDVTKEIELPGEGFLCCGEGSYGSEGFFARLDQRRHLTWLVYLEESNPFIEILTEGTAARFVSSSGVEIVLDIDQPAQ